MPKFAAFSGRNSSSKIFAPAALGLWPSPPQASVMESPRNSRSTLPFLAMLRSTPVGALPALVGAALAVGVLASLGYHQVLQEYADLLLGDMWLLVSLFFCAGAIMGLEHRVAALVLAALALGAALLPGVASTHNLTISPGWIAFIETHYSLMPGAGARLGAGFTPGTDVKLWYGLLFPVIAAGVERLAGPMSMAFYLTSIQWLQVGFAALAVVAYRSWRPRDYWYLLISLMLLLPWLSTCSVGVYYPNHSAWRHLNFALAACAVIVSD